MKNKTVCIAGLGYIGLPLATVIAEGGTRTYAYDIDRNRVETVQRGDCPIEEPGLAERLKAAVEDGRLEAGLAPISADYYIITVPTPVNRNNAPDMSYVQAAVEAIAPHLKPETTVIIESTSPVGTTEWARALAQSKRPELFADNPEEGPQFVYCPERIIPGDMLRELEENDRTMGGLTGLGAERGRDLYATFCRGEIILTEARIAEMVKLSENAFRDVNIAFANELSMICDAAGIDTSEAIRIANRHPRVNILTPGVGVGGHCIAVDPWFLIRGWPERSRLMMAGRAVNEEKTRFVIAKIRKVIDAAPETAVISCLGLAYKPNVGDLRESPSMEIAEELRRLYPARVLCCEPYLEARDQGRIEEHGLVLTTYDEAVSRGDIILELTPHREFKDVELRAAGKKVMRFQR
ncbi:MAG: nucleotide sugar dehydrogenase [Neomegalonema sp.]|nr:nucleotide sugar dehydrogenase [Neomegalonema sp.]